MSSHAPRIGVPLLVLPAVVSLAVVSLAVVSLAADDWKQILKVGIRSEYSKDRQDAIRQIDTSSRSGLRVLWGVLESLGKKDPLKFDWFVREGAYEALLAAEGEEAEKEIQRILGRKGYPSSKEAIVYSVIWRIRKDFVDDYGGNDDRKREEATYLLRKTRGLEYFKLLLPRLAKFDPDGKRLEWIRTAFLDKEDRVRIAAINGFLFYPNEGSIQLLIDNLIRMRNLEKKSRKNRQRHYREWVMTRYALEQLTGQYYRDNVEDWVSWWTIAKDQFSLKERVEKELAEEKRGRGRTVVVRRGGVEVTVNMKIAGAPDGYPLLVLSWRGFEPDYFRPWFHGVEEFCKVYYLLMPQFDDFKGLARGGGDNIARYPTEKLAEILQGYMEETGIEKMAVLGHGAAASMMAMTLAARVPEKVTHLIMISPSSAGDQYGSAIENVKRYGVSRKNREVAKGADNILIDPGTNKPVYEPADGAEAGGLGRALSNLRYADPTMPEIGSIQFLFRRPGGTQVMNDNSWSIPKLFGKKPSLPVLIFAGERNPWTPIGDLNRVESQFSRARLVRMADASEMPFLTRTYEFTRYMKLFFDRYPGEVSKTGEESSSRSGRSRTRRAGSRD